MSSFSVANISGVVYKDFNMNGIKDGNDAGVIGVPLSAVCSDGKSYTAKTDSSGAYSFTDLTAGTKCRVEADPSSEGVGSGTNALGAAPLVDMVNDGTTHNISVGSPSTYCQANPDVIMAALPGYYTDGDDQRKSPEGFGTIFKVPTPDIGSFNARATIEDKRTTITTFDQTGAIWGAAWKKGTKDLFVASNIKRYVPIKGSTGDIYKIDIDNANAISLFTTVPNSSSSTLDNLLSQRDYAENQDLDILPYVGREGLGDLDINEDETKLYTINMYKKELVVIDAKSGDILENILIPNPYGSECQTEDVRPWAIKARGDDVFIGSVCDTGIESGIGAVVQKYSNGNMTTIAKTNSLQYMKPRGYSPKDNPVGDANMYLNWGYWQNSPMLTDIEFTNNGDLVLGYVNRSSYNRVNGLNGDIRKMCLNSDGTYTDESTALAPTSCSSHEVIYEGNYEKYYEFYVGDHFGSNLGETGHPETASGSLAMAPGAPNIIVGMIDGTDWWQPGAIGLYSNTTGDKIAAQAVINNYEVLDGGEREVYGFKSGGMGDVELLCDPAPIEIGNYVWMDINLDGIQDPTEPALSNVPVSLTCSGEVIGETKTDDQGHYYFGGLTNVNLLDGKSIKSEEECSLSIAKVDVNGKPATIQNPNSDADDQRDNDAIEEGENNVITFKTTVSNDHSLDFGIEPALGCVTGILFEDTNSDGTVDDGDTRAPQGIKLTIIDAYKNSYDVSTDEQGEFSLENVPAGEVTVIVDSSDTDIPEGATWSASELSITVIEGTPSGDPAGCSETVFPYTLPAPIDQDPKDVATCANPTSITWEGAMVSSISTWSKPVVDEVKTITTVGGKSVDVSLKITADSYGKYNQEESGTNAAFGEPYLTLYLGDQESAGDGIFDDPSACTEHGYELQAGESFSLEASFSESVILDNWRIRDVDSGDIRNSTENWNWQDGIKVEAFDKDGQPIAVEAKIGSAGEGLIVDENGIVHTDPETYNGGDVAHGEGSTPNATNGHIVLSSNFVPISKLVVTHIAGSDVPCQTRSALAMAGLAVCKPLHIEGTVYNDEDGVKESSLCVTSDNEVDGTAINQIDGELLRACLLDDTNKILDTQDLDENGHYNFEKYIHPDSKYAVMITTQACTVGLQASAPKLFDGWVYEGEVDDSNVVDGLANISVASEDLTEIDFAINKKPIALDYTRAEVLNPEGDVQVEFDSTGVADMKDFILDNEDGTPATIKITKLSSSAKIYYAGEELTVGKIIEMPDISQFKIDPNDGDVVASFSYVAIDKACQESNEALFSASFKTVNIGGTLYLDESDDGHVDGKEVARSCDDKTELYISLIGEDNKVLASVPLTEEGSYAFHYGDGVRADSNYHLVLSSNKGEVGELAPEVELTEGCSVVYGENIESLTPETTDSVVDGKIDVYVEKEDVLAVNFSITPTASIGDKAWLDDNHNGIQDEGEEGLANVGVTLYEADCTTEVKTTTTADNGNYIFEDLTPNDYCLGFTTPNGYALTTQDSTDDNNDSDVDLESGKTAATNLESGEKDMSWDAGFYKLSSLGDYVWYDDNHNGIQDTDELPVPNVKVTLYESDCSTAIIETRSDTEGKYLFENLEPNDYCVGFDDLPIGYQFTPVYDNTGSAEELDCNVDPGTGKTPVITLPYATDDMTWDMGIIPKCEDEEGRSLQVFDDQVMASRTGSLTVVNVLANDYGNLDVESIRFVSTQEGAILWENGTAVAGISLQTTDTLVVEGEGTWTVSNDGTITFKAEDGFTGIPEPVYYVINCKQGSTSNVGKVEITSNCVCDPYEESSVPAFSNMSMLLVLILTSLLGLFFFRKELK
jgi:hypothetical protein